MTPMVRYLCYTDKLFTRIYATRKKNFPRDFREDKSEKTSYVKKREKCVDDIDKEFAYQSAKYQRVYIRQIPNTQSLVIYMQEGRSIQSAILYIKSLTCFQKVLVATRMFRVIIKLLRHVELFGEEKTYYFLFIFYGSDFIFLIKYFLRTLHFRLEISSSVRNSKILQQYRIGIQNHKFSAYSISYQKISIYFRNISKIIYIFHHG